MLWTLFFRRYLGGFLIVEFLFTAYGVQQPHAHEQPSQTGHDSLSRDAYEHRLPIHTWAME